MAAALHAHLVAPLVLFYRRVAVRAELGLVLEVVLAGQVRGHRLQLPLPIPGQGAGAGAGAGGISARFIKGAMVKKKGNFFTKKA